MPERGGVGKPSQSDAAWAGISGLASLPEEERDAFLPAADYFEAFRRDYARADVTVVDKLECGQEFQEPGFVSWEAFHKGAWSEALDALVEARPAMSRQFVAAEQRGLRLRRVRYVELPPSEYVLWETAVLRERADLGEEIRVVVRYGGPGKLAPPPDGFPSWSFSGPSVSMS
ncbi:DUF6879 family protein [Streptomyces alanosinicus]|uniref:DUF6879 domain-containing protein n=1 Tax=Streptomyces alanosinicus TaxID=68171 RepID=A0A919D2D8_9ACTN|nr:DUF6879 family protein [Streptomyces alanosinicus]GHE02607.1 hypothetical protein GCM10010339_26400 [Streptomyces alanosinicus]